MTTTKTTREWLNELPDGYRELALANCEEDIEEFSMYGALLSLKLWRETPEKEPFWLAVCGHYSNGSPLPPPPKKTTPPRG